MQELPLIDAGFAAAETTTGDDSPARVPSHGDPLVEKLVFMVRRQAARLRGEIDQRIQTETQLRRINRVHGVISAAASLIVRSADAEALLSGACRVAVEKGGFGSACAGRHDEAARRVVPIAGCMGDGSQWRPPAPVDVATHPGSVARAVRDGRPVVLAHAESIARSAAMEWSFRDDRSAIATFPLAAAGRTHGTLSLCAAAAELFRGEALELLEALAENLGLALDDYEKRQRTQFGCGEDPTPNRRSPSSSRCAVSASTSASTISAAAARRWRTSRGGRSMR